MQHEDTLLQISTMMALLDGVFESETRYESILPGHDFGIGTFDHLDGEMIGFDGFFYQLRPCTLGGRTLTISSTLRRCSHCWAWAIKAPRVVKCPAAPFLTCRPGI